MILLEGIDEWLTSGWLFGMILIVNVSKSKMGIVVCLVDGDIYVLEK